jgi:ribonuclease HI
VVDNDLCPCCQLEVESVIHALWNCPGAQDVWGCGPILFQKCPSIFSDMAELVSYLFTRLNDDLMSLTVVVFHRIWLRRNKMIFEEQFYSPMKVFIEASQLFEDFKMYNLRESLLKVPNVEGSNICKSWKLPNAGFVKVNWDASLNPKSSLVGLGCVIRNENGYVIGAKCYACRATVDPLCAEAMAALFALEFGYEMDFVNIESEGDSLQVIKGLCNPDFSLDRFGHFMDAIKQKASCFFVCKWRHCYREANEVAHILARKASSICLSHVWVEDLPYFISSTSFRDLLASRL